MMLLKTIIKERLRIFGIEEDWVTDLAQAIVNDVSDFENPQRKHTCKTCKNIFRSKRFDAVFCSNACRQKAYRKREDLSCQAVAR